ncbi:MAG: DNA polymerase III subunit delta [Alphaproteobacteria bacterium]|nr:DNA polymerase III subunit delta [Alphaproteobacteria bacterium]
MKLTEATLKPYLSGQKALTPIIFIYGDDSGKVKELSDKIIPLVTHAPDDPFLHDRLDVADLIDESSRLYESSTTLSFGGGVRLIRIDGLHGGLDTKSINAILAMLNDLAGQQLSDVVILVQAPGVDAKLAQVKALEKATNVMVVRCYQEGVRDLSATVSSYFKDKNKAISADAMNFLQAYLGHDKAATLLELDKLDLYTLGQSSVGLEACQAVLSNAPAMNVFKLCDMLGKKNFRDADKLYHAMLEEGEGAQGIIILIQRHFRRLSQLRVAMDAGMSPHQACSSLKPPVFDNQKADFIAQAQGLPARMLSEGSKSMWADISHLRDGHSDENVSVYMALKGYITS